MEQGTVRRPVTGTAQGGVISPLMCNVYLHRLDRAWRGASGPTFATPTTLVMCRSRGRRWPVGAVDRAAGRTRVAPETGQDRIVQLTAGGEGVDFLGFHHRLVRSRAVPAATGSPSWPAGPHARR